LKVRDYEHQRRRAYLALREKGGQRRRVPVHGRAAEALDSSRPFSSWVVGRTVAWCVRSEGLTAKASSKPPPPS
jgi:hypothetical protein